MVQYIASDVHISVTPTLVTFLKLQYIADIDAELITQEILLEIIQKPHL